MPSSFDRKIIRARICEDLGNKLAEYFGYRDPEGSVAERYYSIFCSAVSGKVVELIFTGNDAFERHDDNIWIPDIFWTEVASDHPIEAKGSRAERQAYAAWLNSPEGQEHIRAL